MSVIVLILFIIINIYLVVAGRRQLNKVLESSTSKTEIEELTKSIFAFHTMILEEIHIMFIVLFICMILIVLGL